MSTLSEDRTVSTDDAVEALLEKASPRPAPPSGDELLIRNAVHAEWQAVTRTHRTRGKLTKFAIAATVLLAVAVSFNSLRLDGVAPIEVATISKSHGSIHLLGEQSDLYELTDLATISAGQTIVTDKDSGIGLIWGNGGSLRIDQNTRIEFTSGDSIFLESGRIYFDSKPAGLQSAISSGSIEAVAGIHGSGDSTQTPALKIETAHGTVAHLGTQYMTYTDRDKLSVSVREGQVEIDGEYHKQVAEEGQQLTVSGNRRPSVTDFPQHGTAWNWVESIAPDVDVDGRSTFEFLQWVGRETGLNVQFDSPAAEQSAHNGTLHGIVDQSPLNALRTRMRGEVLDWDIKDGVIKVSAIDSGSSR